MNERDFLLQTDWRQQRLDDIGTENWITVYQSIATEDSKVVIYSALIPNERVSQSLERTVWDYSVGSGQPGCVTWYENGEPQERYDHFTAPGSVQPLVLVRDFHGIRDSYTELLEEFRLFHNLFHDRKKDVLIKFTDDGNEDEVVRVKHKHVEVRLKEIKQFLAFKEMHLAILFEVTRFSELSIDVFTESEKYVDHSTDTIHYVFFIGEADFLGHSLYKTLSRTHGKKLIPGMPKEESGIYPYEKARQYEDFIIGIDGNGEEITFSANPDNLANFFGANRDNPFYITPVFFRKEVLSKYYSDPERYEVHDGYIESRGYWILEADTNHERYVIVYLGDLGGLPYSEQHIWRSYNIVPDGKISNVAYRRGILNEWAEPEDPAFIFKFTFRDFQDEWYRHHNWYLFKPLSESDEHLFTGLRIPLTDGFSEFDSQVIALTKLMIDSLNESKLSELIEADLKKDVKGISKFEAYLKQENVDEHETHIAFLRRLQNVRSMSAAHRKSSDYEKRMSKQGINIEDLPSEFRAFLESATQLLKQLQEHFLVK